MSDWRDRAACRGEDPELFFPVGTTGPALAQTERARAVCHRTGTFGYELTLPAPVQEGAVTAALTGGVLTVRLPKTPAAKITRVLIG